jgi:hypothetical protein
MSSTPPHQHPQHHGPHSGPSPSPGLRLQADHNRVLQGPRPSTSKSTTSKRLSPAEIANRRIKGHCFRCDEKFVPSHRECKRFFIIEVLIDDDDDTPPPPANGDPTISIHALTGIQLRTSKTMQVQVSVGTTVLTVLLDSGSTHNFIDVVAAEGMGIVFQGGAGLRVVITNDDRLSSPGCCSDPAIDISGEPFSITCYGLALVSPSTWS